MTMNGPKKEPWPGTWELQQRQWRRDDRLMIFWAAVAVLGLLLSIL